MKLTKKECEEAFRLIWYGGADGYEREMIEQLINDYFELEEKYYKLESENIGLKQTIANFKEKQEKFFKNI